MKKLILLSFFIFSCSDYNDITTSMAEINKLGLERKPLVKNNGTFDDRDVTYFQIYLPPELQDDVNAWSSFERVVKAWKANDSYYDNIIVEVNTLETQNTRRGNDKEWLEITQNAIDKYGENYILKELKNSYNSPKISSIDTNLKINGKFFGRRIMYYISPKNVNALEYYYFTIHDGVKYAFAITFIADTTVSETINFANNIAGTIKFK